MATINPNLPPTTAETSHQHTSSPATTHSDTSTQVYANTITNGAQSSQQTAGNFLPPGQRRAEEAPQRSNIDALDSLMATINNRKGTPPPQTPQKADALAAEILRELPPPLADLPPPPSNMGPPPAPPSDLGPPPALPPRPANYIPRSDAQAPAPQQKGAEPRKPTLEEMLKKPGFDKAPAAPKESVATSAPKEAVASTGPSQAEKDIGFKLFKMKIPRELAKGLTTIAFILTGGTLKNSDAIAHLPAALLAKVPPKNLEGLDNASILKLSKDQIKSLSKEQMQGIARAVINNTPTSSNVNTGSTTFTFNSKILSFFDNMIDSELKNTPDARRPNNKAAYRDEVAKMANGQPEHEFKVSIRDGITPEDLTPQYARHPGGLRETNFSVVSTPFPDDGADTYIQNGADATLGGWYNGKQMAMDETISEAHPDVRRVHFLFKLASPEEGPKLNETRNNQAVVGGVSKAVVFKGIDKVLTVDQQRTFQYVDKDDGGKVKEGTAYGNVFEKLDKKDALSAATFLAKPTKSNIIYTTAPNTQVDSRGDLTKNSPPFHNPVITEAQVDDLFSTLFNNYTQVAETHEGAGRPTIHGGLIGAGAFQNSVGLNTLLQMVAARKAGVDVIFHNFPASPETSNRINQAGKYFNETIVRLMEDRAPWTDIRAAIMAAVKENGWQNGVDRPKTAND